MHGWGPSFFVPSNQELCGGRGELWSLLDRKLSGDRNHVTSSIVPEPQDCVLRGSVLSSALYPASSLQTTHFLPRQACVDCSSARPQCQRAPAARVQNLALHSQNKWLLICPALPTSWVLRAESETITKGMLSFLAS